MSTQRPPLPPFTPETAAEKVRLAEDGWNSRDPEKVALAYTVDSYWRNAARAPDQETDDREIEQVNTTPTPRLAVKECGVTTTPCGPTRASAGGA